MKSFGMGMLIFLAVIILSGCGASATQLKMQEPEEGKCVVVGSVLFENNGVDNFFDVIKSDITVILVGKSIINGKESIEGYRFKTDANGYFFLPNVPQGAYVLKGIELSLGYRGPTLITSRFDGTRQIFLTTAKMIDYVVRSWPEEVSGCVNDLGINYLMINPSMGIYFDQFSELRDNVLALKDITHTMPKPESYYRAKYPKIECFTE